MKALTIHSIKSLGILIIAVSLLSACAKQENKKRVRWSAQSSNVAPHIPQTVEFEQTVESGDILIKKGQTRIQGFAVEGTHTRKLVSKSKGLYFIDSTFIDGIDFKLIERARKLKVMQNSVLEKSVQNYPAISQGEEARPNEVVFENFVDGWEPVIRVERINDFSGQVTRFYIAMDGEIRGFEQVQHSLSQGQGTALDFFSRQTHPVTLNSLKGNGRLDSPHLRVTNGAFDSAHSPTHEFHFPLNTPSFDEVHVYYTLMYGMQWFQEKLNVAKLSGLQVKVYLDKDTPRNAAFYYNKKIRLGRGDGKIYRDTPKDQSIVLHELAHAYIEKLASLDSKNDAGSMNEAFADFFAASMLNNPKMGEFSYVKGPFKRNIDNKNRAYDDFTGGKYNDSLAVSGTLWQVLRETEKSVAVEFANNTLVRLHPWATFDDLKLAFAEALVEAPEQHRAKIEEILKFRNWM